MVTIELSPAAQARLAAVQRGPQRPGQRWLRSRRHLCGPDTTAESDLAEADDFETEEEARAEDRVRAKGLWLARPVPGRNTWTNMGRRLRLLERLPFPLPFPPRDSASIDRLLQKLEGQGTGSVANSLASAVTIRNIRLTVLGAMMSAFDGFPDEELATATVINQRWIYTPSTLDGVTARQVKNRFRTDLNRIGLLKMPGPFIAILHGEFEPRRGVYVLHFHILTTREKAEALKRLRSRRGSKVFSGYQRTASGAAPIVVKPMRHRFRQVSYLLKSFWPARAIRRINGVDRRERRYRRISEPFASQVLLWLDRQRLRDLVIMHGCWSLRSGGPEAMRALYLSVHGPW